MTGRVEHAWLGTGLAETVAAGLASVSAYALQENREAALACLERTAARRKRLTAARAAVEPALEALRGEPRLQAIVRPATGLGDH